MSTNPKDLAPSKRSVDASLRKLQKEMEQENTLVQDTPAGKFQRVLKIYSGIKPLLTVLGTLPLIPSTWRTAIVMFKEALEALSGIDITAAFKAGKDL